MRLDHIAYRTKDRKKTTQFFIDAFGYRVQQEFQIEFSDGSTADCIALEPPEKLDTKMNGGSWSVICSVPFASDKMSMLLEQEYHLAPEIFVSDGTPDSIVGKWVEARNGVGGIHHLAYQVDSVSETMQEWRGKGYAEFTTPDPLTCPGLTQVFTKPSELTGVIYEFIERGEHGFCKDNVKNLMESTKDDQ
ncbi:MAG: hypothetical protein DWQ19_10155 [Crenarchaeota archaeon]|nr:MAG: hypothetical protein DWQ19_10155 [Thermoproteota archaeon]